MVASEAWLDAQVAVLGSVLIKATKWAGIVLSSTSDEDYSDTYRPIYQAIRAKFNVGEPIDPVTIRVMLGEESRELIFHLMAETPSAENCGEYLKILRVQSNFNRKRALGEKLANSTSPEEADQIVAEIEALAVTRPNVQVLTMTDGLHAFLERQRAPKPDYLPWGIAPLDNRLYIESGDFVVLGGYPSDGKTALAVQTACQQAATQRVGFFSLETSNAKLYDRMVAMRAQIDMGRIKRHEMTDDECESLAVKSAEITGSNLTFVQATGMTVGDIRAMAISRRFDAIYVDYLQLIRPDYPNQSSFEQVTQISKSLHELAQSAGIIVVALSQLTRPDKQSKGEQKAPGLHSLRQSGQIEQDADAILLLYREDPTRRHSRRLLKVAKNKDGEANGVIAMQFDGATQTFRVDRNDPSHWRPETDQVSIRELPPQTPVPFEED